jgi:helix-turn-helix protein
VLETRKFAVGVADNKKAIQLAARRPARRPKKPKKPADEDKLAKKEGDKEEPEPKKPVGKKWAALPVRALWNLEAIEGFCTLLEAKHDAEKKQFVWLAQAKRGIRYLPNELPNDIRFYDAEDARLYDARLGFQPTSVKKGERIRIFLSLPSDAILEETKQVILFKGHSRAFPAQARAKIGKNAEDGLPGNASWDITPLNQFFTLLKVRQDEAKKHVIWLAQAKRGIGYVGNEVPAQVRFYDAEEARIYQADLVFQPSTGLLKGERLRISLALPENETLKQTKLIFLLKRDQKIYPGRARVKIPKDAEDNLPGKAAWDIKLLEEFFTLLKVRQDEAKKHVIWLAEAKRGIGYVGNEVPAHVRFYDAEEARIYQADLVFQPSIGLLKGERLRISLALPENETLKQTKQVFLLARGQKVFPGRARVKIPKDAEDQLPGKAAWDFKLLEEFFTLLKVSQDEAKKHVIWLAQAKRGIGYVGNEVPCQVHFYDGMGTSIYRADLRFDPSLGLLKGERLRISLALPSNEILKQTKKVVLKKR